MFDEIRFSKIERLPNYVFAEVNAIKMAARRAGEEAKISSLSVDAAALLQHLGGLNLYLAKILKSPKH